MSMFVPSMESGTGRIVLGTGESFTIAKSGSSFGTAPERDPRHRSGFEHAVDFSHRPWGEEFASHSARQISGSIIVCAPRL